MKLDMHVTMLASATKTTEIEQQLSTLVPVGEGGHTKKYKLSPQIPTSRVSHMPFNTSSLSERL